MTAPQGMTPRESPSGPLMPPSNLVGAFKSVPNLLALAAYQPGNSVNGYPDGFPIWVDSLRCWWTLETSAFPAVPFERINSVEVGRQWCRQLPSYAIGGGNPWLSQTQWYVGGVTANDENAGTIAAPISTVAEWQRRIGTSVITNIQTLNISANNIPATMTPIVGVGGMVVLDYQRGAVINATCIVAAFADLPAAPIAAGTDYVIIQGAGGFNWTAHVGRRATIVDQVTGAAKGIFQILAVNPGGAGNSFARISRPVFLDATVIPATTTAAVAVAGDTINIETLLQAAGVVSITPIASHQTNTAVVVANTNFTSPSIFKGPHYSHVLVFGCRLFVSTDGAFIAAGCAGDTGVGNLDVSGVSLAEPIVLNRCGFGAGAAPCHLAPFNVVLQDSVLQASQFRPRGTGNLTCFGAIGIYLVAGALPAFTDANGFGLKMQLNAGCDLFGFGGGAMPGIHLQSPGSIIVYAAADPPTVGTGEGAELRNNAAAGTYAAGLNVANAAALSGVLAIT